MFISNYSNGRKEGRYESYYENRVIEESFMYKADSIDGVYRYYYSSGNIWTEKAYNNGLLLNVNLLFDRNGELNKGTLINGNGTLNYYTEDYTNERTNRIHKKRYKKQGCKL
jgi:antitoxin component YwqK of YwqJK toxin-antitoxin module